MAILDVQHIEKSFGSTKVLRDINFSLEEGPVLAIIGSSCSGKTTLLRCLNFLETPAQETISVRAEVLFDAADAVDGSYVLNHVSLVDPAGDAFRKEYAEKYNGAKMELNGYMAHDAFLLWCAAVEKAGSDDPQALADAYSPVEVQGMAGQIQLSA